METNINSLEKNTKTKFFIIFKLIMSILYFIPAFFVMAFGLLMNLIILIGAAGDSKLHDTSNYVEAIKYIGTFSIIPAMICVILFVITIISSIKFFKNKYNKKLNLFVCIVFIIINIALLCFAFWSAFYILGNILIVITSILIIDFILIIKNSKSQK